MKFLESTDTEISIVISWVKDDFDNQEYVDVSGYERSDTQLPDEQNHSLALEFSSWDKWLGMDVDENNGSKKRNFRDEDLLNWFTAEYPNYSKRKLDMGKSCIRFKKMDEIPFELIGQLAQKISPAQWIEWYENVLNSRKK